MSARFRPEKAILELDGRFHTAVDPADFAQHVTRWRNQRWAEQVGLGALSEVEWIEHFGKFAPLEGSLPKPLALAYHGHQFQVYNPQIGDGRGFLFAQWAGQAAGPWNQGIGTDAVVTHRRWPPDAKGRCSGDHGGRNAGGAGRLHLESILAD